MVDAAKFIEESTKEIKDAIGSEKAIVALSGGVDSSVCALLAHKAIGSQLIAIFLNHGLMREKEPESVEAAFKKLGVNIKVIDVKALFFESLKGKADPEEKRKAFREAFYQSLGKAVRESGCRIMIQGTIKPDIIETQKGVKTQHNILEQIGIDPGKYGFKTLEPVRELYKPDVREVGKALGLPEEIYQRMPFPGPALATRIVGEVTQARVDTVRKATSIVEEEVKELKPFQAFAVLLNDMATGVDEQGKRKFGQIIVVRSVESTDAMKATATDIPFPKLKRLCERITTEVPGVVKVVYDITPKPPSTIEYV